MRDLTGDGTSDVVWYNSATGKVDLWKIAGGQWAGSVDVGPHPLGWKPAGFGDLNGDGTNDLLWHNPTTGNVDLWKLVNGQWAGSVDHRIASLGYPGRRNCGFRPGRHRGRALVQPGGLAQPKSGRSRTASGAPALDLGSHPLGWAAGRH